MDPGINRAYEIRVELSPVTPANPARIHYTHKQASEIMGSIKRPTCMHDQYVIRVKYFPVNPVRNEVEILPARL